MALVTVGSLIGKGGLGELILGGFRNNFYKAEILTGTILCVALALVLDLVLAGARAGCSPRGPRERGSMNYFARGLRLAQRPAELDQPRRPAGPAGGAPAIISLWAVLLGCLIGWPLGIWLGPPGPRRRRGDHRLPT